MARSGKQAVMGEAQASEVRLFDVAAEFLRHRDNVLFVVPCAALMIIGMATGPTILDVLWFGVGWLIFLPQEWLTHVYILHWRGGQHSETLYRHMYRLHYGHHDFPRRDDLMYMPLWLTVPMTIFNLALYFALAPDTRTALAAFAGGLAGYLLFEWSHLLCHVPYVPKTGVFKSIRERHLAHHIVNERRWFSVSPPAQFIDRVMGTAGVREQTQNSRTARFLLPEVDAGWLTRARAALADRSSGDLTQSGLWLRYAQSRRTR